MDVSFGTTNTIAVFIFIMLVILWVSLIYLAKRIRVIEKDLKKLEKLLEKEHGKPKNVCSKLDTIHKDCLTSFSSLESKINELTKKDKGIEEKTVNTLKGVDILGN